MRTKYADSRDAANWGEIIAGAYVVIIRGEDAAP